MSYLIQLDPSQRPIRATDHQVIQGRALGLPITPDTRPVLTRQERFETVRQAGWDQTTYTATYTARVTAQGRLAARYLVDRGVTLTPETIRKELACLREGAAA